MGKERPSVPEVMCHTWAVSLYLNLTDTVHYLRLDSHAFPAYLQDVLYESLGDKVKFQQWEKPTMK